MIGLKLSWGNEFLYWFLYWFFLIEWYSVRIYRSELRKILVSKRGDLYPNQCRWGNTICIKWTWGNIDLDWVCSKYLWFLKMFLGIQDSQDTSLWKLCFKVGKIDSCHSLDVKCICDQLTKHTFWRRKPPKSTWIGCDIIVN